MGRARTAPPAGNGITVELVFNGEPHHKFVLDATTTVTGGQTFTVSAAKAKELLAASWANVSIANPAAPAWPDSDDAIEELAAKLGVELPSTTNEGGAPEPTLSDKIAALEAAGYTPESAAAKAANAEPGSSDEQE